MFLEIGQTLLVTDRPYQRLARAACTSAARRCDAWLSPTSAIRARASRAPTPKAQGWTGPDGGTNSHGSFGVSSATAGRGRTMKRSRRS